MVHRSATDLVKRLAAAAGFDRCGIAQLGPLQRQDYVREWLSAGRAGSMGYLHRRLHNRLDPRTLLPGARSAIVVALNYHQRMPDNGRAESPEYGRIAMY